MMRRVLYVGTMVISSLPVAGVQAQFGTWRPTPTTAPVQVVQSTPAYPRAIPATLPATPASNGKPTPAPTYPAPTQAAPASPGVITPAPINVQPIPAPANGGALPAPANGSCSACEAKPNGNGNGCACEEEKDSCSWCKLGDKFDLSELFFGKDCKLDIGGWGNAGYHSNSDGFWNDQPDRVNLHQIGIYAEKLADGKDGFDWGFRAMLLYGIDGPNTQAFGNRPGTWDFLNGWGDGLREGLAMPELYATLAYEDFSLQLGRFYTLLGYEVVPSYGNFFYSHAYTFNFSEPFTHTGAIASYKVSDKLTVKGGWVAGNDSAFQINQGGSAFIGGFTYAASEMITLSNYGTVGDLGYAGNGVHNTALITVKPTKKIEWVLQNDICKHDGFPVVPGAVPNGSFNSVALVNYLFYTVNDCVKLGTRTEWYDVNGASYYEVTAGINFIPQANIRIRPEYRYQWAEGGAQSGVVGPANPLGLPLKQSIFGVDVVVVW